MDLVAIDKAFFKPKPMKLYGTPRGGEAPADWMKPLPSMPAHTLKLKQAEQARLTSEQGHIGAQARDQSSRRLYAMSTKKTPARKLERRTPGGSTPPIPWT